MGVWEVGSGRPIVSLWPALQLYRRGGGVSSALNGASGSETCCIPRPPARVASARKGVPVQGVRPAAPPALDGCCRSTTRHPPAQLGS